jgi:hypothetical protein
MNYAKIGHACMCILRAAHYLADRPNVRRSGLQPLIHLDVSAIGEFDAGKLQSDSWVFGARPAATSRWLHSSAFALALPFARQEF